MDMDMGSSTMGSSHPTMTMDMPASASSGSSMNSSMGGMDMGGMGMGGQCKISMLWNWNVLDTCFISDSWHVTSRGMFAGSCIGVVLLVISLEFLRRSVKEFDRYIIKQHVAKYEGMSSPGQVSSRAAGNNANEEASSTNSKNAVLAQQSVSACTPIPSFRPSILQQAVRALLHMLQFAVAYFVMLLAMYYNGYIIICIFIGAYLGAFIFHWEPLGTGGQQTSAAQEATVCCG